MRFWTNLRHSIKYDNFRGNKFNYWKCLGLCQWILNHFSTVWQGNLWWSNWSGVTSTKVKQNFTNTPSSLCSGGNKNENKIVDIKINSLSAGYLVATDGYMNLQLANTEEYIDGAQTGNLGEVLVRCNNVLYIRYVHWRSIFSTFHILIFQSYRRGRWWNGRLDHLGSAFTVFVFECVWDKMMPISLQIKFS